MVSDRAFISQVCIVLSMTLSLVPRARTFRQVQGQISGSHFKKKKICNIGHNFRMVNDRAFIFHLFIPCVNALPDDKILDWSKLKQIADDILKCI